MPAPVVNFKMMPWFDDVVTDSRSSWCVVASFRVRRRLRQNWSVIVDMQCSGRTGWYFHISAAHNAMVGRNTAVRPTPN